MASESSRIMPRAYRPTCMCRVYHLLRICWRVAASFAKQGPVTALRPEMSPESMQMLLSLALGFAVAGMCSHGYQLFTSPLPGFSQRSRGPSAATWSAVPLLMVSAPFLILRNTLLGHRDEGRRFDFVFLATLIAGFLSLASGLTLVSVFQACGLLLA